MQTDTITAAELADIYNVTPRMVLNWAEQGQFKYIKGPNNVKLYYIDSLPRDMQTKIWIHQNQGHLDSCSTEEIVERFEMKVPHKHLWHPKVKDKVRMICEAMAVPGANNKGRKQRIDQIAESYGYSYSQLQRLVNQVKKGQDVIAETKNYGVTIGPESLDITVRAWDKEVAELAINLLMANDQNHVEKRALYEQVEMHAREKGLRYGTYESFLSIDKRISDSIKKLRDTGVRGLREDVIPAIPRDFTAYRAMECLIGDQHKADYNCLDYNGDLATLELFVWLDFRTQMAFGAVAYKHYNKYTVGQALLNAARYGLPAQTYCDWGKPEESDYMVQLVKQLSEIGVDTKGIKQTHAKVRHPQAKPIEAFFGRLDKKLKNKRIPGYCKRLSDPRENELQQAKLKELIRSGDLPSIDEMTDVLFDTLEEWNDHNFKNRGVDNGKSPRQILAEESKLHPVTTLSSDVLEYIFLPEKSVNGNNQPLTIKRSQVKFYHDVFKRTVSYYAPELADNNGLAVSVRYNPFDPAKAWVFDQKTRRLICTAEEWGMINPKNMDQVSDRIATQERLIKRIRERYTLWLPDKPSKVRQLHPREKEAREIKKSEDRRQMSDVRVMRTPLDGDIDLATGEILKEAQGGQGYRPLVFEREEKKPLPRLFGLD